MSKIAAKRILRFNRVVADLDRAETFYRDALGFETTARGPHTEMGDGKQVVMHLNEAVIALIRFDKTGAPYPPDSRSDDLWFQHLAIAIGDMNTAYARLTHTSGWRPISQDGPQQLPPENGNVRAFKFRDPDGHPLELIWFPGRTGAGIDHSALSVASTSHSQTFYQNLGFQVREKSLNHGPAQDNLDALPAARVQITALRLPTGPGLELLGYQPPGRPQPNRAVNDIATDWVTIEVATLHGDRYRSVKDPDGHMLLLVDQGAGSPA